MIKFTKLNDDLYKVYKENEILGEITKNEFGYFVFNNLSNRSFSEYCFRIIADKLRELNASYDYSINKQNKNNEDYIIKLLKEVQYLYHTYGIYISVHPALDSNNNPTGNFTACITSIGPYKIDNFSRICYLKQEDAYNAAIKYVKQKLIR